MEVSGRSGLNRDSRNGKNLTPLVLLGYAGVFVIASLALSLSLSARAGRSPAVPVAADGAGETVQYPSGETSIAAFIARPTGNGKHPAVIVVHDNMGLNEPIKDSVRSLATAGFVAIAPDLLSRSKDAAGRPPAAQIAELSPDDTVEDVKAAYSFLMKDPGVDTTKISAIGIGWGGWRVFKIAEDTPLYRAVVFYGTTPILDDGLSQIKTPILAHYAQYDFLATGNSIWTEKMLGKHFTSYIYPDASRGFYVGNGAQPPTAAKGNAEASKQAWARTITFLKG